MSSEDTPSPRDLVAKLLNTIPEDIKNDIAKRRALWRHTHSTLFNKAEMRFNIIRDRMMNAEKFASMTIDEISADLGFLCAWYTHLVEFEGIIVARKTINERLLRDNIHILRAGKLVEGRGFEEWKGQAVLYFSEQIAPFDRELRAALYDMALIGAMSEKQTSRSDAIKMVIEVYKKRHDKEKEVKHTSGGNR